MSRSEDLRELLGEIRRFAEVSPRILGAIGALMDHDVRAIGRTTTTSVAAAGLIENYYTAVETALFRIAQTFGNNLDSSRRHSDLLNRMAISVPGVRPAVLSESIFAMLDELLRFRHFKPYYFQLEYDWTRLEHLIGAIRRVDTPLRAELARFEGFIDDLLARLEPPAGS